MIHGLRGATCLLLAVVGWWLPAAAQATDQAGWREFDLLNGRLLMTAPATAMYEKVQADNIMAANPSTDSATQIRVKVAGTEIVVYVKELFALFPVDPETFFHDVVWGGTTPSGAARPHTIGLSAPLTAYGVAHGSYRHPSGNNVLAALLVAQADGTVQYLYAMTWDVDSSTLKRVSEIAERMVMSLRAGPRQSLADGRSRLLTQVQGQTGPRSLTVTLPEGYVMSNQEGPDFTVYHINRLTPLDLSGGRLGIYVGDFPSYFYAQQGYKPEDLTKVPATILGHDSVWLERQAGAAEANPGWTHREIIQSLEASPGGLKLHLFISAPNGSGELEELTRIVEENLRLTSP